MGTLDSFFGECYEENSFVCRLCGRPLDPSRGDEVFPSGAGTCIDCLYAEGWKPEPEPEPLPANDPGLAAEAARLRREIPQMRQELAQDPEGCFGGRGNNIGEGWLASMEARLAELEAAGY